MFVDNDWQNGWLSSPDGGKYPFVLGFKTKRYCLQQENGWLKKPEPFALKNKKGYLNLVFLPKIQIALNRTNLKKYLRIIRFEFF